MLPRISIITVCLNMDKYIEKTILSVLNQKYENLEYIIVDGGSTDNTMEIIRKYSSQLSRVISEPDNGMYDALKKGFSIVTGDIVAWLNADDTYMPWTFQTVARVFQEHQDVNWLVGLPSFIDENKMLTKVYSYPAAKPQRYIQKGLFRSDVYGFLQQESMFWRKELYLQSGGLDDKFRYAGDFELWMRFALYSDLVTVDIPLAAFMRREGSLSSLNFKKYNDEVTIACKDVPKFPSLLSFLFNGFYAKHIFRFFTIGKSPICTYSFKSSKFKIKNNFRRLSNVTLRQYISELTDSTYK